MKKQPKISEARKAAYVKRLDQMLAKGLKVGGNLSERSNKLSERSNKMSLAQHLKQARTEGGYCLTEVMAMAEGKHPKHNFDAPLSHHLVALNDSIDVYMGLRHGELTPLQRAVLLRPLALALYGMKWDKDNGEGERTKWLGLRFELIGAQLANGGLGGLLSKDAIERAAALRNWLLYLDKGTMFKAVTLGKVTPSDKLKAAAEFVESWAHEIGRIANYHNRILSSQYPFTTTNKKKGSTKR